MDLLKLGFRSIVGITMPGTILLLSVLYGLWVIDALPNPPAPNDAIVAALASIAFLFVSYALGSILSLRASGRTDALSASLIPREHRERGKLTLDGVKKCLEGFSTDDAAWEWISHRDPEKPAESDVPKSPGECHNLWAFDEFPYPCWSLIRLGLYCPREVFTFYWPYRQQILAQLHRSPHFFNYCKMAVYARDSGVPGSLGAEIQQAESNVRFFAGAFDALVISSAFLVGIFLYHGVPKHLPLALILTIAVGALVMPPALMERTTGPWMKGHKVRWLFDVIRDFSRSRRCVHWAFRLVGVLVFACLFIPGSFIRPTNAPATTHLDNRFLWEADPRSLGLIALAAAEYLLAWGIVAQGRLRRRRHAEVAAVMDAFFLAYGTKEGAPRDGEASGKILD
jgi:hypothetical protein